MNAMTMVKPKMAVGLVMCAALGAALAPGCTESGALEAGALSLQWTAGPVASCSEAGLVRVEVELRQGEQLAGVRTFACDDGGAFIDAVEPGSYEVAVQGIDEGGRATFEAVLDAVRVEEGREVDLGMVRMTARRAQVQLQWFFSNGRLCSQNLVDTIAVTVYDSEYYMIGTSEFPCETGVGALEPLPAGAYELEVVGLATGGDEVRARRVVPVEVTRGEDVLVEVPLDGV